MRPDSTPAAIHDIRKPVCLSVMPSNSSFGAIESNRNASTCPSFSCWARFLGTAPNTAAALSNIIKPTSANIYLFIK